MISMTGYGQSVIDVNHYRIKVEMKSFNHRFSEIMVRMPRQLFQFEDQIKKVIQSHIYRGKVDIFVNIEGQDLVKKNLHVDWDLLDQYLQLANKVKERVGMNSELKIQDLLFQEQIVSIDEEDAKDKEIPTLLLKATENAVQKLMEMRIQEGNSLKEDLSNRIKNMETKIHSLKSYAPNVAQMYRERLKKRVQEFLDGKLEVDESRMLTEVAIYADKSNIDEELTRLNSHIKQFLLTMEEGHVIGRKLDFIVQEMNREVNTIGAKANDVHISREVVELKSEIEKIKEQVQNIE